MTVHPAVVESVIKLNIQQHSHGVTQHIGNAGHIPCSDAVMRAAYTVSQAYASLQPFFWCALTQHAGYHYQSIDRFCHYDTSGESTDNNWGINIH